MEKVKSEVDTSDALRAIKRVNASMRGLSSALGGLEVKKTSKKKLNYYKILGFLIVLVAPILAVDFLITTESTTPYTVFEDWVANINALFFGLCYVNGVYALFFNKNIWSK